MPASLIGADGAAESLPGDVGSLFIGVPEPENRALPMIWQEPLEQPQVVPLQVVAISVPQLRMAQPTLCYGYGINE